MFIIIQFILLFVLINSIYIEANNSNEGNDEQSFPPNIGGRNVLPIPMTDAEHDCLEKKELPTFTVLCLLETNNPAKCSEEDYANLKKKAQLCSQF
ncbi:hypothetical protein Mgra_00000296 [Meloidogyne graminicola]|uniref:Uncharacterized protein n=1 Tax=Meloidogyne graminicola TaxID=189291 RepID=A0A8T0A555_9BILA|nr:hypothetical protein Mgra_00000296 [Meloidogyne graminicola]